MAFPASLIAAVEAHPCFTGCYVHEVPVAMCVDPARVPATGFCVSCQDCLMFHVGALASLLPPGTTQYTLAQDIGAHMRAVRGYRWAFSGYHAGISAWLSVAYYGDGLFLVDSSRNHFGAKDVDLLAKAFSAKLAQPDDPRMVDPFLYGDTVVFLSCSPPLGPVRVKDDILRSPQCRLAPVHGFRRVSIVEFLPLTAAAQAPSPRAPPVMHAAAAPSTASTSPPTSPSPGVAPRRPKMGEVCPTCGAEVKERALFSGTFVGCMC